MWEKENILKINKNKTKQNKRNPSHNIVRAQRDGIGINNQIFENAAKLCTPRVPAIFLGNESRFAVPAGSQRFLSSLMKEIFPTPTASVLMRAWCHSKASRCP